MGDWGFRGVQFTNTHTRCVVYAQTNTKKCKLHPGCLAGPHPAAETMTFAVSVISCLINISINRALAKPYVFLTHTEATAKIQICRTKTACKHINPSFLT